MRRTDDQFREAPRILDKPPQLFTTALQILNREETRTFYCLASGLPKPRIYWLKEKQVIHNGDMHGSYKTLQREGGVELTIVAAQKNHKGNYTCRAENRLGRAEHHIWVVLSERIRPLSPDVKAELPVVSVQRGYPANLTCTAAHVLKVYTMPYWLHNGSVLQPTDSQHYAESKSFHGAEDNDEDPQRLTFTLHVHNVTEYNTGNYTCVVQSHIGKGSADINLSLRVKQDALMMKQPREARMMAIAVITSTGLLIGLIIAAIGRHLRRKRKDKLMHSYCNQLEFQYDVFITYSGKDYGWVRDELIPVLDANEMRYSIHCRDFEIGKAILDNMAEFIYKSRKIIAVMSCNYMSSKYCRGELDMALYRTTETGDSSLILVRLDRIDKKKLPKSIRHRTFLDYSDKNERKGWKQRLIKHLKSPLVMISPSASEEFSSIPMLKQNSSSGEKT